MSSEEIQAVQAPGPQRAASQGEIQAMQNEIHSLAEKVNEQNQAPGLG